MTFKRIPWKAMTNDRVKANRRSGHVKTRVRAQTERMSECTIVWCVSMTNTPGMLIVEFINDIVFTPEELEAFAAHGSTVAEDGAGRPYLTVHERALKDVTDAIVAFDVAFNVEHSNYS